MASLVKKEKGEGDRKMRKYIIDNILISNTIHSNILVIYNKEIKS